MKYTLSDERRAHLLLHFERDDNAGSHFDLATFPNPDTLLASIETMQPSSLPASPAIMHPHFRTMAWMLRNGAALKNSGKIMYY